MPRRTYFAPLSAYPRAVSSLLAAALLPACSSTAEDSLGGPANDGSHDAEAATGYGDDAGQGDTDTPSAGTDDGAGDSDGGDTAGSSQPGADDRGDDGEQPLLPGCPSVWPRGWVYCEDFQSLEDPLDSFSQFASGDGAFAIDDDVGAMRADYVEGVESAGWALVSFGESPISSAGGTTHATDKHFEEIYWRVKVRHERGWPDVGPGWFARATAFANADWAQAAVAQLQSAGAATNLEAVPLTCLNGQPGSCAYNDATALEPQDALPGTTPLFSNASSGQWHCVEAHVRLNQPGLTDGLFEFWVDDNVENVRGDIDWRGSWVDFGLNAVTIENFWPGGATADLTRWMDDIVISTERIGCD